MKFLISPRKFERLEGACGDLNKVEADSTVSEIPAQGFRLLVHPAGVLVEAADEAGVFYGSQLLTELGGQSSGGSIPCCRIEDWPDFEHRGYMLDISRDRVPTMEQLFHLVDCLAKLRYNQLQLYTEHTFAYEKHATVWANASPMTAAEICELDAYCRERKIELVPNQNSFGHMERWLEHDAYRHLAECPEGFRHPISGAWRPQGSVLKPDAQSLDFLGGLYAELLPNFISRKSNLGGDEPWELGWGASRERVEAEGKHKVYADFLTRICKLAERHGAEPMCWADVLFEEPASIDRLPESIHPIIWGYEVNHPFEKQCAHLAELGRSFYVAPGDSTWTSYTGRLSTMLANVKSAATIGKKHGAAGLLMTHWGDGGHPQTWPVSLPGMVWAGLNSWNVNAEEVSLEGSLRNLLGDSTGAYVTILLAAGRVDETLGVQLVNRSYFAHSNLLALEEVQKFEPKPGESSLRQVIEDCTGWLDQLPDIDLTSADASCLRDELELVIRLNQSAAQRSLRVELTEVETLRKLYRLCWGYRSRAGGLSDSLAKNHVFSGS